MNRRNQFFKSFFSQFTVHSSLFTCLLLLSGCGYSATSMLPGNLKTVYVETFQNNINFAAERGRNLYFPLLEQKVRAAIVDRYQFDGNLKMGQPGSSDLVLRGKLNSYERSALRFTDNDDVQEYRVHVIVSLELYDTATGAVRWSEPSFAGEATYFVTGPTATTEESAVEQAVIDLARRIVERTIEDW